MKIKRIAAFILAVATAFALGSCSNSKSSKNTTTAPKTTAVAKSEVEKCAKNGEIMGVKVKLGESGKDVIDKYQPTTKKNAETSNEEDTALFEVYKGSTLTSIHDGANQYFYVNDSGSDEIAIIACASTAYNFAAGNCYSDDIIFSLGKPDVQDIPAQEDLFFLFGTPENVTRLTYLYDNSRLDFILVDDNLCMTVLTDTTLFGKLGHSVTTSKG